MVIRHRCAPIGHSALGIILCDLIEALQSALVPEIVQQRECPVEINAGPIGAGSLHVGMSPTLFRSRGGMLRDFPLCKRYYRTDSKNEDSDPEGPHYHPPYSRTSLLFILGLWVVNSLTSARDNDGFFDFSRHVDHFSSIEKSQVPAGVPG